MNGKNNYESSWADQWDPEPAYYNSNEGHRQQKDKVNNGDGAKKKMEEGLAKSREAATAGMKKVKTGAAVGFKWVKDKYQKTTRKQ